jgi:DNA-binding response OmpR family regulator
MSDRQRADAGRTTRPDLKILFMTGHAETAASSKFLLPGMEIIAKPFKMGALANRFRRMMADGR